MTALLSIAALAGLLTSYGAWSRHRAAMPELRYLMLGISGAYLALISGAVILLALAFYAGDAWPAIARAFETPLGTGARQFAVVLLWTAVPLALVCAGQLAVAVFARSRAHVIAACIPLGAWGIAAGLVSALQRWRGFYPEN